MRNKGWRNPAFCFLLVVLGILVFHNLSQAGFVGDDYDQVLFNPVIRDLSSPIKFLTGSTFNSGGAAELRGTYYKPAMTGVFALVYGIFGPSAMAFHLVQVALGIVNALLAYFLFRSLFPPLLSFFGAALFLIHPANSEAVQYVSNYQDVLFMTFGLTALNIEAYRTSRAWWWNVIEAGLLLLAALSKETGLLFVPLLMAWAWFRRAELRIIPAGLALLAYGYLRIYVSAVSTVQAHYTPMETADTWTRILNVPAALFYYLKNFFVPWPLGLAQHWIYREVTFAGFFLPLLGVGAAVVFAVVSIRKFGKPAKLFVIWCVLSFGLHSQLLIPLDATVADRWHYLPSLGMLGLVLLWLQASVVDWRSSVSKSLLLLLAVFALWTYVRNGHWKSEQTLLTRDLRHQPDSFAIMSQLGYLLLNQNRTEEACPLLAKSVELAPKWWVNTNNLGVCLFAKDQVPEALSYFKISMDNGRYHLAFENYAKALIYLKRTDEARTFLISARQQFPENAVIRQLSASLGNASN
jgi:tetratricopeptide (TPR) repeat protein